MKEPKEILRINRFYVYTIVYLYAIGGYSFTNHFSWRIPTQLALTSVDLWTPFLPWTGWVYITVYAMPMVAMVYVQEDRMIRAQVLAYGLISTIAFFIFTFFPTTYPRPALGATSLDKTPLALVHMLDTPANCWPSLHVGYSFLTAFFVYRVHPRWGKALYVWSIFIAISTLTTKQHYLWDVLAGIFFAYGSYRYGLKKYNLEPANFSENPEKKDPGMTATKNNSRELQ